MDPADLKRVCTLIRVCTLSKSNLASLYTVFSRQISISKCAQLSQCLSALYNDWSTEFGCHQVLLSVQPNGGHKTAT